MQRRGRYSRWSSITVTPAKNHSPAGHMKRCAGNVGLPPRPPRRDRCVGVPSARLGAFEDLCVLGLQMVDEVEAHRLGRGVLQRTQPEAAVPFLAHGSPARELGRALAHRRDLDGPGVASLVRACDVGERHQRVAERLTRQRIGPTRCDHDQLVGLAQRRDGLAQARPFIDAGRAAGEVVVRAELRDARERHGQPEHAPAGHGGRELRSKRSDSRRWSARLTANSHPSVVNFSTTQCGVFRIESLPWYMPRLTI